MDEPSLKSESWEINLQIVSAMDYVDFSFRNSTVYWRDRGAFLAKDSMF